MPTAVDLIGHNPALQEHWLRRLLAMVIDVILVGLVTFFLNFPFAIFATGIFLWPFLFGIVWWLYSALFEGAIGGTVGKKLVALHVVAIDGNMDFARAFIRNISKIHPIFILLDFLFGAVTEGDPRQRFMDRIARTSVQRVDQQAYMEEQFRMMQRAAPFAYAPQGGPYAPPPSQAPPPPQGAPPAGTPQAQAAPAAGWPQQSGGWPGSQPPQSQWPQHQWDEEGRLKPQMRFCTACGGQLVARGDGKLTCVRCGTVY